MKFATRSFLIAALAVLGHALGGEPTPTRVEVKEPSQFIVEVKGIVCSFCAYGARKNMARVDFLDKSKFKDGLLIETEKGLITTAIREGVQIDFGKVFKAIEKGGYEILALHVHLLGTLKKSGPSNILTHAFTGQEFALVSEDGRPWQPERFLDQQISVQGFIPGEAVENPGKPALVRVKSVKPAESKGKSP